MQRLWVFGTAPPFVRLEKELLQVLLCKYKELVLFFVFTQGYKNTNKVGIAKLLRAFYELLVVNNFYI